jgi:NTE family protein
MDKPRKKVGLALGSGGVRGLAHIGVLKALIKNNIPIDYMAGCSIGAWMGAHYALYQDLDRLIEATISNKKEKFAALLEPTLRGGLVRGDKVLKLLKKYFGSTEFKDLKIPLKIVATDLVSGDRVVFAEGKIVNAIRASISVPYVFAPFVKGDKVFVDGGISNPVPDNIVRDMGADIVIAVNLDNFLKNGTLNWQKQAFTKKMTRSIDIMRHYLAQYSIDKADVIIEPNLLVPGIIGWKNFFTTGEDERLIRMGEEETEKQIEKIKELLGSKS